MESRGGVTGGMSLREAINAFEAQGYRAQFSAREGGELECSSCHASIPAQQAPVRSMRRVEGASDPADMSVITAIECPRCGARGTGTFCYGPTGPPEDAEVLRALGGQDRERTRMMDAVGDDDALVSDSGWLEGPPNG